MKIIFVCPNFNPINFRKQPWRHAYELARHMSDYVSDLKIITNRNGECNKDFMVDNINVRVLRQKSLRFPTKELTTAIIATRPDLIYWFGNPFSGIILRHYKKVGIPFVLFVSQTVLSIWDLLRLRFRKVLDYKFDLLSTFIPLNGIVRFLNCDNIKLVIVPSRAIGDRLKCLGVIPEKVELVPLTLYKWYSGKIISKRFPVAKECVGPNKKTFKICYFGGSDTIRGTDVIIRACRYLTKLGASDFRIILLLRRETSFVDKDELYLRQLTKKYKLENFVHFISKILSKEELISYLFDSDLVVLPFKIVPSEPPISILEALSLGKCVVTTEISGLPELVRPNHGELVKPASYKALANKINSLMNSPRKRINLENQAKAFCSQIGGVKDQTEWTLNQFSKVIDS